MESSLTIQPPEKRKTFAHSSAHARVPEMREMDFHEMYWISRNGFVGRLLWISRIFQTSVPEACEFFPRLSYCAAYNINLVSGKMLLNIWIWNWIPDRASGITDENLIFNRAIECVSLSVYRESLFVSHGAPCNSHYTIRKSLDFFSTHIKYVKCISFLFSAVWVPYPQKK